MILLVVLLAVLALAGESGAQTLGAAQPPPTGPGDGPPAPQLPDTISRDDQGRATVIAVRVPTPMRIDGTLDEALYTSVRPASQFIQMEPQAGAEATEKTEVWVSFDDDNLYVTTTNAIAAPRSACRSCRTGP